MSALDVRAILAELTGSRHEASDGTVLDTYAATKGALKSSCVLLRDAHGCSIPDEDVRQLLLGSRTSTRTQAYNVSFKLCK